MTARVERGGLVTRERSRPVCGPLWVLKLCIGAFYRAPLPENVCFGFQDTGKCVYEWNANKEWFSRASLALDLLFFSCIWLGALCDWVHCNLLDVYCVGVICGCSWILPAIKTEPSESVFDFEGETVALIVDTQWVQRSLRFGLQESPLSRIWLHWMDLMGGINWIWLLFLWRMLLVCEVGGIVKGRSERRREEKTLRTRIRCSFVDWEEKQKTYFPVDLP